MDNLKYFHIVKSKQSPNFAVGLETGGLVNLFRKEVNLAETIIVSKKVFEFSALKYLPEELEKELHFVFQYLCKKRIKVLWVQEFDTADIFEKVNENLIIKDYKDFFKSFLSLLKKKVKGTLVLTEVLNSEVSGFISISKVSLSKCLQVEITANYGSEVYDYSENDYYVVDVKDFEIIRKEVLPQNQMTVLVDGKILEIDVPIASVSAQKLLDAKILELAETALKIHKAVKVYFLAQYALCNKKIYITGLDYLIYSKLPRMETEQSFNKIEFIKTDIDFNDPDIIIQTNTSPKKSFLSRLKMFSKF